MRATKLILAIAALIASLSLAVIAWVLVQDRSTDRDGRLQECESEIETRYDESVAKAREVNATVVIDLDPMTPDRVAPSYSGDERAADLRECRERWG